MPKSKKQPIQTLIPHGPREAFYNNLPTQHPMIVCLCGASFDGGDTWEDVGAEFDDHLKISEGTRESTSGLTVR